MVEVLISGAGPAGAVAATVLARQGVRVLLVDRARFPRDKLCGDTLNPGALAHLRVLGLRHGRRGAGARAHGHAGDRGRRTDVAADYPGGLTAWRMPTAGARRDCCSRPRQQLARRCATASGWSRPCSDNSRGRAVVRGATLDVDQRRVRVPAAVTIAADGRRSTLGARAGLTASPGAASPVGRRRLASPAWLGWARAARCTSARGHYLGRGARCPTGSPTSAS